MPRAALERLQLERLRETLAWAESRVPLYRDRLNRARLVPEAIQTWPTLRESRSRSRTICASTIPWGLFAVPAARRGPAFTRPRGRAASPRWSATPSGDLRVWREVMARSLAGRGREPGDMIQVAYGYGLFTGGLGFHDAAEHMGLTVVPASSGNTLRQILLAPGFPAAGARLHAVVRLYIGETMREQGIDPRSVGLRYGMFGAEPWTEAMRAELESLWGLTALDFYGLSEIIGPGVAGECIEGRPGLHVTRTTSCPRSSTRRRGSRSAGPRGRAGADDPDQGGAPDAPLPHRRRHSLDPAPCRAAARPLRIARIKGRTDDMLVIKGVNVYPSQLEAALLAVKTWPRTISSSWTGRTRSPRSRCRSSRPRAWCAVGRLRRRPARRRWRCPRAWPSACGATRVDPRDRGRPAQDHSPQRRQGGAGDRAARAA